MELGTFGTPGEEQGGWCSLVQGCISPPQHCREWGCPGLGASAVGAVFFNLLPSPQSNFASQKDGKYINSMLHLLLL